MRSLSYPQDATVEGLGYSPPRSQRDRVKAENPSFYSRHGRRSGATKDRDTCDEGEYGDGI